MGLVLLQIHRHMVLPTQFPIQIHRHMVLPTQFPIQIHRHMVLPTQFPIQIHRHMVLLHSCLFRSNSETLGEGSGRNVARSLEQMISDV